MPKKKSSTPSNTESSLGARQSAILEAVITEHADTAHPVGSQAVQDSAKLNVSSATIRADMATLERDGYLLQPHTSSGRIPTEKGYRYFVDHLGRGKLAPAKVAQLGEFIGSLHGEITAMYEQVTAKLADVTKYPAFFVRTAPEAVTIRDVNVIDFTDRRLLVVVTFTNMDVAKTPVNLDFSATPEDVRFAKEQLTSLLAGVTLQDRVQVPSRDTNVSQIVRRCVEAVLDDVAVQEGDQVFVGGTAKVADQFDTMETARSVLDVLERELVIVSLIKQIVSNSEGLSVAIGSEHGYEPLANCAVVVAPVTVDGVPAGTVGLLGPTRMKYPEAMAAAEVVSSQLSEKMSEHE